jgi:hypothetical protein
MFFLEGGSQGALSPQEGRLGEGELVNLIFAPGFSTAEKITNVSGRGVGMDVVNTNIEKIGIEHADGLEVVQYRGRRSRRARTAT